MFIALGLVSIILIVLIVRTLKGGLSLNFLSMLPIFFKRESSPGSKPEGKFFIEAVILKIGSNKHIEIRRKEELDFTFYDPPQDKEGAQEYHVSPKGLWRINPGFLSKRWIQAKLRGYQRFVTVFREGESDPIVRHAVKVDPEILRKVRESSFLSKMFKEWFKTEWLGSPGKVFFIIFVLAGIIVFILYATGRMPVTNVK